MPLVPGSVLERLNLILVRPSFPCCHHTNTLLTGRQTLLSTLCTSVAFFSSLFWVSFFMQDIQRLNPLDLGVRFLPQAVTSVALSPIVGCWMHKIDNFLILIAAAVCQTGASVLLVFVRQDSSYFAFVFPSLILSTLSMDWVRNVGAVSIHYRSYTVSHLTSADDWQQYIVHALPVHDQITGAAILQTVNRLGIPLGLGITTATWSSYYPAPKYSTTNLNDPLVVLERPYVLVFISTLCFAVLALMISPFTRLGKLGVPSTTTGSSLPQAESGLKNINHDGPGDWLGPGTSRTHSTLTRLRSTNQVKRVPQFTVQPRSSSLHATSLQGSGWRRWSAGWSSSGPPEITGSITSEDVGGSTVEDDTKSQRSSTAMAERVIWLVCEDCGASKRIVQPVGDPGRYFYAGDDIRDGDKATGGLPDSPSSASPPSSGYHEPEGSVLDVGVTVDKRRIALVESGPMGRVCA